MRSSCALQEFEFYPEVFATKTVFILKIYLKAAQGYSVPGTLFQQI